jgi:hypothetical protein
VRTVSIVSNGRSADGELQNRGLVVGGHQQRTDAQIPPVESK